MRIAVLGVGLIGGSVGMAARERVGATVHGFDPAPGATAAALAHGAVDVACASVEEAVDGADAVFVAAPVGAVGAAVRGALAAAGPDCVVTDVGSVKRTVAAIDDPRFVGGHPLAGAETAGVQHARADLFAGATWYLTPHPASQGTLYERLHRLIAGLGALPSALDAETHDTVLAAVSHLPHVIANVLVAQVASMLTREGERLPATGPSFRSATRVAGASTTMWRDIYVANADALVAAVDDTIARLTAARELLAAQQGDAIGAWNDDAATDRRRLLESDLAGDEVAELRVAVPNRPGIMAEVALALGKAGIGIADLALSPAADNSTGTIALWIAGSEAAAEAERLVGELGLEVSRA